MYCIINENKIKLLEVAILFFSDYAKTHFKNKVYKLNWYNIFNFFINNGMYDSYDEYSELYRAIESDKEIDDNFLKEKAYNFFNALIKNGEKISELFIFYNESDKDKIMQKEKERKYNEQKKRFDSIKCFKCKHFMDRIVGVDNATYEFSIENIMKKNDVSFDTLKNLYLIKHRYNCKKREDLVIALMASDSYPFDKEKRTNKKLEENNEPEVFKYEINEDGKAYPWVLHPLSITKNCKYFDDSHITFDEFIKKYYEI